MIWGEFKPGSEARIQSWVSCQPDSGGSETNFEFELDEKPTFLTKGTGSCASMDNLMPPTSRPTPPLTRTIVLRITQLKPQNGGAFDTPEGSWVLLDARVKNEI